MTSGGDLLAGRYLLLRPLGRGGMAEVWEAQDDVLRRRVALKVFFAGGEDADARRAVAEMHTLAGLSHPNLVTVHDAGRDGDRTFLVLELVTGSTLADRLVAPGLDPATVASMGAQLAGGLAYIHGRGIVHRDVKPANVLMPVRDHVDAPLAKLTDFGIAQHAGQDRLTQAGMTIGTARYLAPEQVTGRPIGPPTDIYALGLVLLEALGHPPAWTGTPAEIALARLTRPPEVPPGLPTAWATVLRAMLAADPGDRPSAADVRAVFAAPVDPAAAAPDRTAVLPADAAPPPARTALLTTPARTASRWRGRRGVLAGGVALLAAALAVVIIAVTSAGSDRRPTSPAGTPAATAPAAGSTPAAATSPAATTSSSSAAPTPTDTPSSAAPASTAPPDRTPPGQTKTKKKDKPKG